MKTLWIRHTSQQIDVCTGNMIRKFWIERVVLKKAPVFKTEKKFIADDLAQRRTLRPLLLLKILRTSLDPPDNHDRVQGEWCYYQRR